MPQMSPPLLCVPQPDTLLHPIKASGSGLPIAAVRMYHHPAGTLMRTRMTAPTTQPAKAAAKAKIDRRRVPQLAPN
jgi:hypothetical protein